MKAKPDCTGQRFGMLTVLGKSASPSKKFSRSLPSSAYKWRLQCECGRIIELYRNDFDKSNPNHHPQISCGCKRKRGLVDNKKRPVNITDWRWGSLVAIKLSGCKDKWNQHQWIMQCDCGNSVKRTHKSLNNSLKRNYRITCGNRANHQEICLTYPPTPNPYPMEAGELLLKYLPLTKLRYIKVDSEVEDEMRDRLIRICWIITYCRNQGKLISIEYEKRWIKKTLMYAGVEIKHKRMLLRNADRFYIKKNNNNIGIKMTNITSNDYPELQLQENNLLPRKRLKFKRC